MKAKCKLVALDWRERTITLRWPEGVPSLVASAVSVEVDLSPLMLDSASDPICRDDIGDGSTVYDDRPRPGAVFG